MAQRRNVIGAALALAALASSGGAQVVNGGFETPLAPPGSFSTHSGVPSTITGWSIPVGSVDLIDRGFWLPFEGNQSIDLNGASQGTIFQDVATTIGNRYELSFALAGNPTGDVKTLDVFAGSVFSRSYSFNTAGRSARDMGWVLNTAQFVANAATTRLTFASTLAGNTGAALDAIALRDLGPAAVVPEPATVALLAGGLAVIGAGARRRRAR